MTRDTDVFVPLGERVSFAEHNKANLFIAVHCDYADTGSEASGATIYSLRESAGRQPASLHQGRGLEQRTLARGGRDRAAGAATTSTR